MNMKFGKENIENTLKQLKNDKDARIHNLPIAILKAYSTQVVEMLYKLLNRIWNDVEMLVNVKINNKTIFTV